MSGRPPVRLRFGADLVRRGVQVADWREAVRTAGGLLVDAGCARYGYTRRLVQVIEKYGPYMVVAPNLALVHAQPGPDAVRAGLSAVTIPNGVHFGHAHFDPVGLVLAIVTTNPSEHLGVVAGIATALEKDPGLVALAVRAETAAQLAELLRDHLPQLDPVEV